LFNHLNVLLIKYFNTNENFIKQSNINQNIGAF